MIEKDLVPNIRENSLDQPEGGTGQVLGGGDWKRNLREGSFRGIRFEIQSHTSNSGRRGQTHEYPGKETPYFEDLGKKAKQFSIECFIVGDDYVLRRDQLIEACEKSGPGSLVHPYLGQKNVSCTDIEVFENISEGRVARFNLSFVESGENSFPTLSEDEISAVIAASENLNASSAEAFAANYDVENRPGFVVQSAIGGAQRLTSTVRDLSPLDDIEGTIFDFENTLQETVLDGEIFANRSQFLIKSLGERVSGAAESASEASVSDVIQSSNTGNREAADRMSDLSGFSNESDIEKIPQDTLTRIAEVSNLRAQQSLIRQTAIAESARYLAEAEFESYDDAVSVMRKLVEKIDLEIENYDSYSATFSDAINSMRELKSVIVGQVTSRSGGLPSIKKVTLNELTPALVVSYNQYEDATRDEEIAMRNKVSHPSFMPALQEIEVLSD